MLAGILRGDPQALTLWFEAHVDAVHAFICYRVGNDPDLAADATQATFATALERLREYDPARGDMVTWLRTLSRNEIRGVLAARGKALQMQTLWDRIDQSLKDVLGHIDAEPLPDEAMEREETRELVGMTLANLPPHYKEVLDAKYVDGLSLETIAQMRQTTIDGVKAMLRRARAVFKETFLTIAKAEMV